MSRASPTGVSAEGAPPPIRLKLIHQRFHPTSSHGFCIGHVVPEAQDGGPIALVHDGDIISVDAVKNSIELRVSEEELERRRKSWKPHPLKVTQGTLKKYVKVVEDASRGCITDA